MHIAAAQRITLVHPVKGGMELQADMLYRGMVERGHQVEVITTAHPAGQQQVKEQGLCTHFLPHSSYRRYTSGWWRASYGKLREFVQGGSADVLLSQSAGAIAYLPRARRELGLPGVLIVHAGFKAGLESHWQGAHSLRGVLRLGYVLTQLPRHYILWRRAAAAAEAIIAVSEDTAQDVLRELRIDPGRVHVVPNGADLSRFAPDPEARDQVRRMLNLSPGQFTAVIASRLVKEKGVQLGLRALARVPDSVLLIAGAGSYAAELEHMAEGMGIASRVRFLGFIPHDQLGRYLAAGDVFLMPSLCREGFPISIVEAMACGLPTIATNNGGIPTAVSQERTGLLVSAGDVEAIADAIVRIARQPEFRFRLGTAARAAAKKRFSLARMVEDTLAVLSNAVENSKRRKR